MAVRDQPLEAFLAAIAADAPAPGAGAAGGVALTMGLACARKAVAITRRHAPEALPAETDARLASLADQALAGADADARCFTAYIDAVKDHLPHGDALEALIAVGETILALCDEAAREVDRIAPHVAPQMKNDLAAARVLIAAARTIHAACVTESRRAL